MWKHLTHPNVLPFLGITLAPFQLVSEWMSGGDLPQYIKNHPGADRLGPVGVPPIVFISRLFLLPAIRRRQGPLLPPLLQFDSWGPQRSMWLF